MIHVLYLLDSLKQRFGVTAVAMNYFRNIDPTKVQIDVVCFSDSEETIVNEIIAKGSKVFFMPKLGMRSIFDFKDFYVKLFTENKYDVVHSHFNQIDAIVFPIAKKYGVKHCISHSHNTKFSDYKLRAIRNWAMCLPLKRLADTWAACSVLAGEFLYGKNFSRSPKSLVINNAIDCDKFAYNKDVREQLRAELGVKDEILLGNVGSLKIQKNHIFLLDIFHHLINKDRKHIYKLLIVGDGPLNEELKSKCIQLGIDRHVIWTGARKDVHRLLQAMDIFLLPSLYEGLPVIGIEAQASGVPCLFSDTITKEVDVCNVTFLPINGNLDLWSNSISNLVSFKRIDVSAIVSKKKYDIRKEGERMIEFYKRCINY
ncbi:glycosyltransferase family 1 protein [Prevotella sp.]|uniref:glycosyltransferase family 1 protein n=1 Tax=Prevotella sp. TaxID=59823 RepID=UPI002F94689A